MTWKWNVMNQILSLSIPIKTFLIFDKNSYHLNNLIIVNQHLHFQQNKKTKQNKTKQNSFDSFHNCFVVYILKFSGIISGITFLSSVKISKISFLTKLSEKN